MMLSQADVPGLQLDLFDRKCTILLWPLSYILLIHRPPTTGCMFCRTHLTFRQRLPAYAAAECVEEGMHMRSFRPACKLSLRMRAGTIVRYRVAVGSASVRLQA